MKIYKDSRASIHRAIKYFSSQCAYADVLGVDRGEPGKWVSRMNWMPLKHAIKTELLTGGSVEAEELPVKDSELLRNYKQHLWRRAVPQSNGVSAVQLSVFSIDSRYWASIKQPADLGVLLHPILTDTKYRLIFGLTRLRLCEAQGKLHILARMINTDACLAGDEKEITRCKQLSLIEQVAIGLVLEEQLAGRWGRRHGKRLNWASLKGKAVDIVSKRVGFSGAESYRRAKYVAYQGIPDVVARMNSGVLSPSAAYQIARQPRAEQAHLLSRACKPVVSASCSDSKESRA